ncbi:hypothetical protein CEXT_609731 [Caerostris extrusa]|uniref:Uncharacterized protein n=1 Tax=Caerostris extrusa TaxID=172846 RepID=A0AAV4RJA1_CAEEX|nr:hypothetical protein CEXT_609731 [Caerostris extrusa]
MEKTFRKNKNFNKKKKKNPCTFLSKNSKVFLTRIFNEQAAAAKQGLLLKAQQEPTTKFPGNREGCQDHSSHHSHLPLTANSSLLHSSVSTISAERNASLFDKSTRHPFTPLEDNRGDSLLSE